MKTLQQARPTATLGNMEFVAGTKLGQYEILGRLGAGGMGEVYRARDVQLGRNVAIKVLTEEASGSDDRLKRFFGEARAASALNHPNILTVYGIGDHEGKPYLVTEFVDGQTLRSLLRSGPLSLNLSVDILTQTLAGLAKAHAIGIIHRDLKPENLMLTADGFVKILDFGLAKLLKEVTGDQTASVLETLGVSDTATGMIVGTAAYMSPEQARGQHADARSDLFSAGVVLYEMLTGSNPFRRSTAMDTISAILRDPAPPLPNASIGPAPALTAILDRALNKNPAERYSSAKEMELALAPFHQRSGSNSTPAVSTGTNDPVSAQLSLPPPVTLRGWKKALIPALLIVALLSILVAYRRTFVTPNLGGPPVIAVMAFENKTTDEELTRAEIGRVLSDAFVQILYDCSGVQVVSPLRVNSLIANMGHAFPETAQNPDLVNQLSRQLQANTILTGSLSQIGETYILNTSLTDTNSGRLIGNYQSEVKGKEHLLEALTSDISTRMKNSLMQAAGNTIEGGRDVGDVATVSLEAYAHFLRGRDLNNEGRFKEALVELNKALVLDPEMGIVWSELSCSYSFSGDDTRSRAAFQKALTFKPKMSRKEQAWLNANMVWIDGNGEEYRKVMNSYIREFPDERDGYFYLGLGWQWLDHNCSEAIRVYEKAYSLTPNYYPITKAIVDCQLELGRTGPAKESLQRYMRVARNGYGYNQAKWRLEKLP